MRPQNRIDNILIAFPRSLVFSTNAEGGVPTPPLEQISPDALIEVLFEQGKSIKLLLKEKPAGDIWEHIPIESPRQIQRFRPDTIARILRSHEVTGRAYQMHTVKSHDPSEYVYEWFPRNKRV